MLKMKNGNLLLEKINSTTVDEGVIYTHDQGMISFEGKVIATFDSIEYPEGCTVVFCDKAAEPAYYKGKKYLMLDSQNVWGIE